MSNVFLGVSEADELKGDLSCRLSMKKRRLLHVQFFNFNFGPKWFKQIVAVKQTKHKPLR